MFYQLQSCTNLENLISKKEKMTSMEKNLSVTTSTSDLKNYLSDLHGSCGSFQTKLDFSFFCLVMSYSIVSIVSLSTWISDPTFKTYQIQNIPFFPQEIFFLVRKYYLFDTQSIIANSTNLQSPCLLVSCVAMKLFLKNISRSTCKTSMMIV